MRHEALNLFRIIPYILVLSVLAACGSSGGSSDNSKNELTAQAGEPLQDDPGTIYLETIAELGPCEPSNKRQLAYVEEDGQFRTCSKAGWKVIELKGKDGTNGTNGSNGKDGVAGKAGEDKTSPNMWLDPVTGRHWLISSKMTYNLANSACAQGWTFPGRSQADEAWNHGIQTALIDIGLNGSFWIVPESGDRQAYNTAASVYLPSGYQSTVVCFKDGWL